MIPESYIIQWHQSCPWPSLAQSEQDLIISRALIEIFSDNYLAENLAFRGGTAINKLLFEKPLRYSEDIDLVQTQPGPFGPIVDKLKKRLSFLKNPKTDPKANDFKLVYKFETEIQPIQTLKLKLETNTREHYSVLGFKKYPYKVSNPWFTGYCDIVSYEAEELIGTKIRALYQRKKGRDLFDLAMLLKNLKDLRHEKIMECFTVYMQQSGVEVPNTRLILSNLEAKLKDPTFLGDTIALHNNQEEYSPSVAFGLVTSFLLKHLD